MDNENRSGELPELMTVDECAAALRISRRGMYARRQRGQAPLPIKAGRRLLYRKSEVLELLGGAQ